MPSKQEIQQYLNLMARALHIADRFPAPFPQMIAFHGYKQVRKAVISELDNAWKKGLSVFFSRLEQITQDIEQGHETVCCVRATEVCLWMDRKIHYAATESPHIFSLYKLLSLSADRPICTDALNTNCDITDVQIHPRYEVSKFFDLTTGRLRSLANRDAFEGLNGQLLNVCYTHGDSQCAIHHAIIPYEYFEGRENGLLRIAFCPMSCKENLLKCKNTTIQRDDVLFDGIQVDGVKYAGNLQARFLRDWSSAQAHGADIVFGPEMLGTVGMQACTGRYNDFLRPLCRKLIQQGKHPPILTILPSFWNKGINSAMVIYQDGSVLGEQRKHTPYIDAKNGRMEALQQGKQQLLVIHIPKVHRIVVMICADFLAIQLPNMRRLICEELGATMILVPAYSHGEQDFINLLPSLKSYGTTVVWGDCCGAVQQPRIIGACSIAGTDDIVRFGPQSKCGGVCTKGQSCVFLTDLPLCLTRGKPNAPSLEDLVRHISC